MKEVREEYHGQFVVCIGSGFTKLHRKRIKALAKDWDPGMGGAFMVLEV
jgi:hypothetical protein